MRHNYSNGDYITTEETPQLNPFLISFAFIEVDSQFLLVQHNSQYVTQVWGAPGGKMKSGESPLETVNRELLEETGRHWHLQNKHFWNQFFAKLMGHECILFTFYISLPGKIDDYPVNLNKKEHLSIQWFARDNLPENLIKGEAEMFAWLTQTALELDESL